MSGTQMKHQCEKAGLSPEWAGCPIAPVTPYLFARPQFSLLHPETQSWSYRWFPLANPWGNIRRWCCLSAWGGTMRPRTCHCYRWGWSYRVTPKFSTGETRTGWRPWTPSGWSYISLAPPVQSAKEPEAAETQSRTPRDLSTARSPSRLLSPHSQPQPSPALCPPARGKTRGGGGWQLCPRPLLLGSSWREGRRLCAFDSRMSCQSGRGLRRGPFFPRERKKFGHLTLQTTTQATRQPSGSSVVGREGRVGRHLSRATHLQQAQRGPQGQPRSMAQHRAQPAPPRLRRGAGARGAAPTARAGATCCARSARPAGAQRFPPGGRRAGAAAVAVVVAAAAAAAAAPGGLRTREAAGAGSAPPFPRCHADPRCLAPGPGRGLPQSKGNFLVSRQRNNAPAREGAPRSQRLRLPRGPEAGRAAPAAPRRRLPGPGVPSGPTRLCLLLLSRDFHFFPLGGPPHPPPHPQPSEPQSVLAPSHFPAPPTPFLPPHPAPPPSLSSFLSSSSAFSRASFSQD